MFEIVRKEELNEVTDLIEIKAPYVAKKAQAGQFVMLRIDEEGERIPLTIAGYDREKGTITLIFQMIGATTMKLGELEVGDSILDFAGPLGTASHFDGVKKAAVIGGGLGIAIAYPQAKQLVEMGAEVDFIAGFRNSNLIMLEEQMTQASTRHFITTDDGSNGNKGFVTDQLRKLIEEGNKYDIVIAIGPLPMMKFVSLLTKEYGIKTVVSMNPVMIDGTGMCGGCRLTVGGETKFACVDGPDFDGHLVDFDEAIKRQTFYKAKELEAIQIHQCRLEGM